MESNKEIKKTIERYENENNESFSFKNETKEVQKTDINFFENEWDTIELTLKKNNKNNIFNKEEPSFLKGTSLSKTIDWDDFDDEIIRNNSFLNRIDELNLNFKLKDIIHPIDNSFEEFTSKKIQDLEILKKKFNSKYFSNNSIKEENEDYINKDTLSSNNDLNKKNINELCDYESLSIIKDKIIVNLNRYNTSNSKKKTFLIDDESKNKQDNNSKKINKYIRKLKNNSNDKIELKNNSINEKLNSLYNIIISSQKQEKNEKNSIINSKNENNENINMENKPKDYFDEIFENQSNDKIKNIPIKKRSHSSKEISFLKIENNEKKNFQELEKMLQQNIKHKKNIINIPNKNPKKTNLIRYEKNIFPKKNIVLEKTNKEVMKKIGENKRLLKILFSNNTHSFS